MILFVRVLQENISGCFFSEHRVLHTVYAKLASCEVKEGTNKFTINYLFLVPGSGDSTHSKILMKLYENLVFNLADRQTDKNRQKT